MASKAMVKAAEAVVESGGSLADAIDAAIRRQIDRVYDGDISVPPVFEHIDRDDTLAYFEVAPE